MTATLLAFSSYYALYYSDAFAPDAVPALFGMMLTFHGMVVFVQEGRFRQLLVKSCVALLLCWPVYALLLPFVVLGMASELVKLRAGKPVPWSLANWLKRYVKAMLFSRYLTLGVVTLLFGVAVLSFNLATEYRAFGGEIPLTELPTVESMKFRLGASPSWDKSVGEVLGWGNFLEQEFSDITRATLPFVASPFDRYKSSVLGVVVGALAVGVACLGLAFVRAASKLPLAALVLAGFCWALPLRRSAVFHDFQALFYIGVPLTTFSVILLYIRKLSSDQFVSAFSVAALLLFVLSSAKMAGVGHDPNQALIEDETMRDFEAIRSIVNDGVVLVPVGQFDREIGATTMVLSYLLAGSTIEFDISEGDELPHRNLHLHPIHSRDRRPLLDYFVSTQREESTALLTPDNRRFFLYDRALYDRQYDEQSLGTPIIASDWDVYLRDGSLAYVSAGCAHMDDRFFLHVFPSDASDLPDKQYEFEHLDFLFADHAMLRSGNKCVAVRELPEYAISSLRTGQYVPGEGRIWEAEVDLRE